MHVSVAGVAALPGAGALAVELVGRETAGVRVDVGVHTAIAIDVRRGSEGSRATAAAVGPAAAVRAAVAAVGQRASGTEGERSDTQDGDNC